MLIESLKIALADTVAFYVKAQNFHWNVEGADFHEFHEFFGDLYEETQGAVDVIAELIRTTGSYAPGSLTRFKELTTIQDEERILPVIEMLKILLLDNAKLIGSLTVAYSHAETDKNYAISNILQDRLTAHAKHAWMISSFLKVR
jgi:starvation-inducible DNA-binding protein